MVTLHWKLLNSYLGRRRVLPGRSSWIFLVCSSASLTKSRMLDEWLGEVQQICETQQHAAFAAFTHGLSLKCFLLRVTNWEENPLDDILESLEKVIHSQGNLLQGKVYEATSATCTTWWPGVDQSSCLSESALLVDRIINQDHQLDDCHSVQQSIKKRRRNVRSKRKRPITSNLIYHLLFNAPCNLLSKREHQPGRQHSILKSMGSLCTKVP